MSFVDKGDEELQRLSIDEFNALFGEIVIPKSIEQNQGYLFAGNVKDKTVIDFKADPTGTHLSNAITIKKYFENLGITITSSNVSYNDMFGSSLLRSLRRGETYRYGVVYYDKYGARSEVYKVADVDIPLQGADLVYKDGDVVNAVCAGAKFEIHRPSSDVVGFQIVRCAKTDEYTTNLL